MSDIYGAQPAEMPDQEPMPAPEKRDAKYWHDQLKDYREKIEDKWSNQRQNLDKLYARHERADGADREYSIFWANIQVLRPSVYARPPVPVVSPRFKQPNPVAAAASETLERTLITTFETSDLDGCMREVRDEYLRYARGTARARLAQTRKSVECVEFDSFTASDFAHSVVRNWREVDWVAFRGWLDNDKFLARFAEKMAAMGLDPAEVPRKKRDQNSAIVQKEDQVPVWEIWCRKTGLVHFVCEDYKWELDTQEPWLDLSSFWPCPKPVYDTLVPGTLRPVPDILQYKDQIEEINQYTARIAALSEALRVKGFYLAGAGDLSDAIETALKSIDDRATLVPVNSQAAIAGGALKDAIVWLPVTDILEIIKGLVDLRRVIIDDIYQIMGISDIQRGDTDSSETATAQQIKSQWGSARIRERQNELSRFARDLTRIAGEIIAENFQPETVKDMSQSQLPSMQDKQQAQMQVEQGKQQMEAQGQQPDPSMIPPEIQKVLKQPSFEEVMQFLADDRARGFTIEIETDSTIQPDEDAEKQRRIEFVTSIGGLLGQAAPLVQQQPQLGPFIGEVLKFTAQAFRAGRPLEGAIDKLVEQMEQAAAAPPPPDPMQQQMEAEQQQMQAQSERDEQQHQAKMEQIGAQTQATIVKAEADMAKAQMGMQSSTLQHQQKMQQAMMPPQGPTR